MKKSEATRQRIIEQAAVLFNQKGIAGTTIDDVLSATGLAKGCLYNHFDSKELLAREAVDFLLARVLARRERLTESGSPSEKVLAVIGMYSNPLEPYTPGGCPLLNFGTETDDTNPEIRERVKDVILRLQRRLVAIMEEGISNGEFNSRLKPQAFATKLFAMVEGGILLSRTLQDNAPMNEIQSMLKKELAEYTLS